MKKLLAVLLSLFLMAPAFADETPTAPPAEPITVTPEPLVNNEPADILKLDYEVGDGLARYVENKMEQAKKLKVTHIQVVIDSPGGGVIAGLHIMRLIVESGIPTTCTVPDGGFAASMAFYLFESAACGERVIGETGVLMGHTVAGGGNDGRQPSVAAQLAALKAFDKVIALTVAKRSGMTVEDYMKLVYGTELWVVGADALKYGTHGLADRVLPSAEPSK